MSKRGLVMFEDVNIKQVIPAQEGLYSEYFDPDDPSHTFLRKIVAFALTEGGDLIPIDIHEDSLGTPNECDNFKGFKGYEGEQ